MGDAAIEYYRMKFGSDQQKTFIHVVKELGELAGALEKGNRDLARLEITEIAGLMHYLSSEYAFDLAANVRDLYTKKLASAKTSH